MNFDLIIIGSGPGGYKAAITAAHLGAKVALVDKGLAGGCCLNEGCIPKKTLVHLASLMADVERLQGRGLVGQVTGDFRAAMQHKDEVVSGIRNNFGVWLKRLGVRYIAGAARFVEPYAVEVRLNEADPKTGEDSLLLRAPKIIIATGSRPAELSACPTDGKRVLNSHHFMFGLDYLPDSVLFIGGGAIGCELGYLLRQFGADVSIVERGASLLDTVRLPERVKNMLERKFKQIGIQVKKNASVVSSAHTENGVTVQFDDGSAAEYSLVFVAAGRQPYTDGLGLDKAGVRLTPEGFIETNEFLESSVPGIYAIGDVKPGPMTANTALHDAKVAAANAISGATLRPNYLKVPVVFHTAFEIAAVGLTEIQAEDAGFEPESARSNLGGSGKARAHHDTDGLIEVVHDGDSGQLLGGCIVGPEAGEQIHMMAAACQSTRGLWFFKDMSYSHPSWCEELETAIDPYTSAFSNSEKDLFRPGIFADKRRG